jgi:tripartite motif-containing protein 71
LASHGTAVGLVRDPAGLCESAKGGVLVCDFENSRIQEFFLDGRPAELLVSFTDGTKPMGISRCEGHYIVTDHGKARVFRMDTAGNIVWSTAGSGNFSKPWDVKVLPDRRIVVSDCNNHRLQILEADSGTVVDTIKPLAPAKLKNPAGLAVDAEGRIYVVDHGNDRVVVLESDGTFVRAFGSEGTGPGQLCLPQGIALDGMKNVLVADRRNQRVVVFRSDGTPLTQFAAPAMTMRILVHSCGELFIGGCDAGTNGGAMNSFLCSF